MRKVVVEEDVTVVRESNGDGGTGSSAVWAIAMVVIVAIIAGVVYYSGVLKTKPAAQKTNIEVKTN
jgi:hypothetical protein